MTVSTRFGKPRTRTSAASATQPAARRSSSQPVIARSRAVDCTNHQPLQPSAARITIAKSVRMSYPVPSPAG